MAPVITARQRNLLCEDLLDRLSGIDGVWLAARRGDHETAQRLGLAYSDDLRLMCEDLGWGEESPAEAIELKTPPDVLRRVMGRLRDGAVRMDASEEANRAELRDNHERNHLVAETCEKVLADLDTEGAGDDTPLEPPRPTQSRLTMFRVPRPGAITVRLGKRDKRP